MVLAAEKHCLVMELLNSTRGASQGVVRLWFALMEEEIIESTQWESHMTWQSAVVFSYYDMPLEIASRFVLSIILMQLTGILPEHVLNNV